MVTVGSYGWVYIEGPGRATITVRAEGTSIKKNVKIIVLPSKSNLYSVTGEKRALKAQWYRNDGGHGQELYKKQADCINHEKQDNCKDLQRFEKEYTVLCESASI